MSVIRKKLWNNCFVALFRFSTMSIKLQYTTMVVWIKTRRVVPSGWQILHTLDEPIFALLPSPPQENYMWHVIGGRWHVTHDMCHVTCNTQGVMNTVSILQNPSSNSFVVMMSSDMWYVTCDTWNVTCEVSNVINIFHSSNGFEVIIFSHSMTELTSQWINI